MVKPLNYKAKGCELKSLSSRDGFVLQHDSQSQTAQIKVDFNFKNVRQMLGKC